jgi:HAD superfamily hydrolase (TIGR01509 family)
LINCAIVFDFDGVIANTELLHLQAYQQVLGRRGWTLDEDAYFNRYLGYNDEDMLQLYAVDQGLRVDGAGILALVREKTGVYQTSLESGSVLYPGAADCVRQLAKSFPLAIASGSLRDEIFRILNAEHLVSEFRVVVSSDDVARSKPAPDPYLKAAADLGIEPSRCVAIEDSHWGLDAARTAGMRTIALTTTSPAEKLQAAELILDSVEQVTVEKIRSLFSQEH